MSLLTPDQIALLSHKEKALLRATEPSALAEVSEESELDALHKRVRRARTKYLTNYRRQAAGQVVKKKARGKAQPNSTKTLRKAEIFEDTLDRVSRRMAEVAESTAAELRQTRLAAAQGAKSGRAPDGATASPAPEDPAAAAHVAARPATRRTPKGSPGIGVERTRRVADTRARGARRQAKRDSR